MCTFLCIQIKVKWPESATKCRVVLWIKSTEIQVLILMLCLYYISFLLIVQKFHYETKTDEILTVALTSIVFLKA